MKPITLVLTTPQGDELGRLPLSDVVVAVAGETGTDVRPSLECEMAEVYQRIHDAVSRERMGVALDPIEAQIVISRALLLEADGEEIQIVLPVCEASGERDEPGTAPDETAVQDVSGLAGLFDLNFNEEGGSPDA